MTVVQEGPEDVRARELRDYAKWLNKLRTDRPDSMDAVMDTVASYAIAAARGERPMKRQVLWAWEVYLRGTAEVWA